MNEKEIEAIIMLLEATLGNMNSYEADKVVRGVVAILKNKLSKLLNK